MIETCQVEVGNADVAISRCECLCKGRLEVASIFDIFHLQYFLSHQFGYYCVLQIVLALNKEYYLA